MRNVKFNNLFYDKFKNSKFSIEICLYLPSIIAIDSSREQIIYCNGELNYELTAQFPDLFKDTSFYLLIWSNETVLKKVKTTIKKQTHNWLLIVNEKKEESKDKKDEDIHNFFVDTAPKTKPKQNRIIIDEDLEIDLTVDDSKDTVSDDCFLDSSVSGELTQKFDQDLFADWISKVSSSYVPNENDEKPVILFKLKTNKCKYVPCKIVSLFC